MHVSKLILLTGTFLAVSGCATKSYVNERMASVDQRVAGLETRVEDLSQTSREALERAEKAGKVARGKFLYSVLLTEEDITFGSADSGLSEGAQSRLTQLAEELKSENQNVYLEIQGHTDATGPESYNQQLGLQRAESVRRYLHTQGVALDRMAVISYGEDAPAADNGTPAGRASNRRVEVVVLR